MSISFSYTLTPPAGIDPASATHAGSPVPTSGAASFTITPAAAAAGASSTEAFYAGAVPALRDAQARLMEVLTAWKEAVGDAEKHKEQISSARGQGKAARMMAANRAAEEAEEEEEEESGSESDE